MLAAKVGQSRTLPSATFSVSLEGDIPAALDDVEVVLAKIGELFALAEEALQIEIERNRVPALTITAVPSTPPPHEPHDRPEEPSTSKQVQYLQNLTKKAGLSGPDLEEEIAGMIGRRSAIRGLSKREAGRVIDTLRKRPLPSEESIPT